MGLACQATLRVGEGAPFGPAVGRAVRRAVRGTPSDVYHAAAPVPRPKGGGSEASVYRWFVKGV